MNLFTILPDNFFSILASPNKHIYLKALYVLHAQFKNEWRLRRNDLASILSDELEGDETLFVQEDQDSMEAGPELAEGVSYSGFAHSLIRKLESAGWVAFEYGEQDFDQYVVIPDYAIVILEALSSIQNLETVEYNSYVFSTYSSLKQADQSGKDYYNALVTAHGSTKELLVKLKMLLNNIKRFHVKLAEHSEVSSLVREHFDSFKLAILDKIYFPLKTFDSVPRFKTPILHMLYSWADNQAVLDAIAADGVKRRRFQEDTAYEDLLGMLNEVTDIYERIDELLRLIDAKNSAYTRATVERMEYMLNVDGSVKGKLVTLLQKIGNDECQIEGLAEVWPVLNVTEESLYTIRKKQERKKGEELELPPPAAPDLVEREITDLRKQVESEFSNRKVLAYIRELLGDQASVQSKDIPLQQQEDFIKLVLGVLKHDDRKSFYTVEHEDGTVDKKTYRIPNMTISRKGK